MSTYIYEDLQPKTESRITPEYHLLLVHIPDDFTRGDVGARVEYGFGRVRVFGKRSIGNNKRRRFNQIYQVPSYCNTSNIKGGFDGNIFTIAMPIIPGSKVPTQQELDDEEEAKQKQMNEETKEKEETSSQKQSQQEETSTPETNKDSIPQKGQQEKEAFPQSATQVTKVESKKESDHETSAPSEEASKDSMSQKGKQEKEASPQSATQVTKVESKKEGDHEISAPPEEANKDSMPQKGNEGIVSAKATFTRDAKLQTEEENAEGLNGHEKKSVGKEESKEDQLKKTITEKVKEIKEESKVSADKVESVIKKNIEKVKEIKEESKVSADKVEGVIKKNIEKVKGKFGDDVEKTSDKRGIYESTKRRIKDMADSTTQIVTRLAKRSNNEENKQKIIYTAAALLVVGISVYASFKYRSSRRP